MSELEPSQEGPLSMSLDGRTTLTYFLDPARITNSHSVLPRTVRFTANRFSLIFPLDGVLTWKGGWVDSGTGLDALEKLKKIKSSRAENQTDISHEFSHLSKKNAQIFHPTEGHEVPKGEQRYISPAQVGVGGQRHDPGRFTPGRDTRYPL
jgi:hypothetical protein